MRILMYASSKTDPASRFRIFQWIPYLKNLGYEITVVTPKPGNYWKPRQKNNRFFYWIKVYIVRIFRVLSVFRIFILAKQCDVIMMNRPLVPERGIIWLEAALKRLNPRIIFDFDDAIHLVGDGGNEGKIANIIQQSTWVTPGNSYLAKFSLQHNQSVTIIPTVVDTKKIHQPESREPGPLRIGWTGSKDTTRLHLPLVHDIISQLANEFDFEFVVISDVAPEPMPGVKLKFVPWRAQDEAEAHQIFDIGLMPLLNNPFERGKCGAKLLIYGAIGIPAVASPVGVNMEIIEHGKTGFLAETPEDWIKYLRMLLQDAQLRHEMGLAARQRVDDNYSVKAVLPKLVEVFEQVMDMYPRKQT